MRRDILKISEQYEENAYTEGRQLRAWLLTFSVRHGSALASPAAAALPYTYKPN